MFKNIISADELINLSNDKNRVIIDCRFYLDQPGKGYQEYLQSHLPDAHYAHLDKDLSGPVVAGKTGRHPFPAIADFSEKCGRWGIHDQTQVVVYDQGGGGIAARLWFLLKWLGHDAVAVLNGGWAHWSSRGLPTTQTIPLPSSATFTPREKPGLLVPASAVERMTEEAHPPLVDSRASERYRGESEPIDPVAGHIPGAMSIPFAGNLDQDGLFLSPDALRERFLKELQISNAEKTVFYCGSGVTACHNLLAMDYAGLEGAKLYPGSWSEWITDPGRPVATGAFPR